MRSIPIHIIFILENANLFAQVQLSVKVTDTHDKPLPGANLFYIPNYDGATTDSIGHFCFKTNLQGFQNLSASFIKDKFFRSKN